MQPYFYRRDAHTKYFKSVHSFLGLRVLKIRRKFLNTLQASRIMKIYLKCRNGHNKVYLFPRSNFCTSEKMWKLTLTTKQFLTICTRDGIDETACTTRWFDTEAHAHTSLRRRASAKRLYAYCDYSRELQRVRRPRFALIYAFTDITHRIDPVNDCLKRSPSSSELRRKDARVLPHANSRRINFAPPLYMLTLDFYPPA